MNLIRIQPINNESPAGYNFIHDFRAKEYDRISDYLDSIKSGLERAIPNFSFDFKFDRFNIANYYQDIKEHQIALYKITQSFKTHERDFKIIIPRLIENNYFLLNGSYYIPVLMLERAPIDVNHKSDIETMFFQLDPLDSINFIWNKKKKSIKVAVKQHELSLDHFGSFLTEDCKAFLIENGFINPDKLVNDDAALVSFFNFDNKYFQETGQPFYEWFNEFFIMPYYKELFIEYFGTSSVKDIISNNLMLWITDQLHIDLVDLKNRRLVFMEYLMIPFLEIYKRTLYKYVKNYNVDQNIISTVNEKTIITNFNSTFRNKHLYDLAIPFGNSYIAKASQYIRIIKENVPLSWRVLHNSQFGIFDPVSVSAQDMGSNVVFTVRTLVNRFGRIKRFTEDQANAT